MAKHEVGILLHFSRVVGEAGAREKILPLLAAAAIEHVGADAAAVLEIAGDVEAKLVVGKGLPAELQGWRIDADTLGVEMGEALKQACGGRFSEAHVHQLANRGGLFGALVLLFETEKPLKPSRLDLAGALADLAAMAMGQAAQVEELRRAHADLRASHEALVKTEKLRALGQMAAGITHDLKNILNPIALQAQVLKRAAARGDMAKVEETVELVRQVVQRGAETIERLRDFSRQTPERSTEQVSVDRLAHEAAELAKPRMASGRTGMCVIREELGAPPTIAAHPGEIVSALLNVIVNAIDAMPGGGTIVVRTKEVRGGALVEVNDDGPGMPPEVARRVLEPFFTTKGQAGTGLGLAMVESCVERHRGRLSIDTAPGKGTTVSLWFPAAQGI